MLRKSVTALILAGIMVAGALSASASTIQPSGTTEIIPNRLTVSWEDESRDDVTINTFRIFGFNVAQLRSMVNILGGTVATLADGSYQIGHTGISPGFREIDFHHRRDIDYIVNHTRIRNHEGRLFSPNQPGWVFLPEFEYNWASVRDVITALDLDLIDVIDDPAGGHTQVIVRRPPRPESGPAVPPPGSGAGWWWGREPGQVAPTLSTSPSSLAVTSATALVATGASLTVSGGSLIATPSGLAVTPGALVASGNSLSVGFSVQGTAAGTISIGDLVLRAFPAGIAVEAVARDGFVIVTISNLPAAPGTLSGNIEVPITRDGVTTRLTIDIVEFPIPPG